MRRCKRSAWRVCDNDGDEARRWGKAVSGSGGKGIWGDRRSYLLVSIQDEPYLLDSVHR